ncbi:hypothetical protein [Salinibacter altiplanensis]|uniref:hypothetical protein n=1 Tax=Salinibacter altiplanensis TaxID=1803181 RepID=UPI001F2F4FBC|nr:hypothetical protein [Salinibacter altiplanensis]
MRILIKMEAHGGLHEFVAQVKEAYADWGGDTYYLPQPPQHPIKKRILKTVLSFGGPKAVGLLLRSQSWVGRLLAPESSEPGVEAMKYGPLMRQLKNAESALSGSENG